MRTRDDELWTAIEIEEQVQTDLFFLEDPDNVDIYWENCPPDILERWVLEQESYAILGELEI